MKDRCLDPNLKNYKDYGGRGITICNRWLCSFENFFSDMGKKTSPKHSLDRIDNDGNYEPSNCRWATKQQQQLNKRTNRILVVNGVSKIIPEWNKEKGFGRMTIRNRIKLGWTHEQCVNTPVKRI